ncbi:ras-related protein Rab-10-like [Paroedura picta]|uniref:ras-related protein Rab-10-like n=1 Tax=Paroedura picta TaxID=143630 RepID=UPI0010147CC9
MARAGACEARKGRLAKVVLAGEPDVGKTAILRRYTQPAPAAPSQPAPSWLTTVGIDFRVKIISLNDTTLKLQIWDTAGQERFRTMTTSYFRGAHGFVLVYDITNTNSFQGIANWMEAIYEKVDDNVEVILLGNKCDKEAERAIPKHRGEKLAWEYGIPFFETSAKDNINIELAFSVLAQEILDKSSCIPLSSDVVDLSGNVHKRTCCRL